MIPVNTPALGPEEKAYLLDCLETGWISSDGPYVARFEQAFAERVGRRHAVAVTNGSAALDAAIEGLRLGPGDEVILPSFTIISCAQAVTRTGARPVVVDSDPQSWCMDVAQVAAAITPRTRAIMAVHMYGLPVDMGPLLALAERHGLHLIEDAAQGIGLEWQGRPCGSLGTVSTMSFYANKLVTCGEGGMVLTDDDALAERVRGLRNLCFQPARRFVHEEIGWNLRMTNMQAALGLAQLQRLDQSLARKRQIGRLYRSLLADVPGLELAPERLPHGENCWWVFGVVLDDTVPFDAAEAMRRLGQRGIGTRPFFWPMHEQPVFRKMGLFEGVSCPVAERIARRGFYLPSGLGLSDAEVEQSAAALKAILA